MAIKWERPPVLGFNNNNNAFTKWHQNVWARMWYGCDCISTGVRNRTLKNWEQIDAHVETCLRCQAWLATNDE